MANDPYFLCYQTGPRVPCLQVHYKAYIVSEYYSSTEYMADLSTRGKNVKKINSCGDNGAELRALWGLWADSMQVNLLLLAPLIVSLWCGDLSAAPTEI